MRLKKTFIFQGTVNNAKGWSRYRLIGKPIKGVITVEGAEEEFNSRFNRVFRLGGKVTEAPRVGMLFPGKGLEGEGYPYILKGLELSDWVEDKDSIIEITLNVVPWEKIEKMRFFCRSKSWWKKLFLDEVRIGGEAILSKSEVIPDIVAKKR